MIVPSSEAAENASGLAFQLHNHIQTGETCAKRCRDVPGAMSISFFQNPAARWLCVGKLIGVEEQAFTWWASAWVLIRSAKADRMPGRHGGFQQNALTCPPTKSELARIFLLLRFK